MLRTPRADCNNYRMIAADLIASALGLPPFKTPPVAVPPGTRCAVTGAPLETGHPVKSVTGASTADFLDVFRGSLHGYVSDAAARCFAAASGDIRASGQMWVWPTQFARPVVSSATARETGRPAWREYLRTAYRERQGEPCAVLLVENFKRRFWHRAVVSVMTDTLTLFVQSDTTRTEQNLTVHMPTLLEALTLVERAYVLGFSKDAIRTGLLSAATRKVAAQAGIVHASQLDRDLGWLRGTPEFEVAVIVAQKEA